MKTADRGNAEHEECLHLLPWLVNGRLDRAQRDRLESHLHQCASCREEWAMQRRICRVVERDTGVAPLPTAGLHRLMQRIDESDELDVHDAVAPRTAPQGGRRLSWTHVRPALAAALLGVSVLLGALGALLWDRQAGPASGAYHTVTSGPPRAPNAAVRAVFAPTVSLSQLQMLLEDAQLTIVAGPTRAGVYSLAVTGAHSAQWSLDRLRTHDAVRFAEPIDSAPAPVAPP